MLGKIESGIFKVESFIITVSLIGMFLAVVIQVITRTLGMSSVGMTEIGMLGMSILTFIGTSAITYSKDHITIELEQVIHSTKVVHWMKIITDVIMIIFGVVFISVAYSFFEFAVTSGDKTIELGIPVAIPVGAMLLGVALMVFHALCDLIRLFQRKKDPAAMGHLEGER
ncbi:TRAP transporter small permease [Planococcus sp. YIM B11945]|uniref:TRAP transporter small permease n=1 Tax=Planococcus sp. YIM B11945 TaxID=3435410 RepID=UPI003D7C68A8